MRKVLLLFVSAVILLACDDDSSPSGPGGASVDFRMESYRDLERCSSDIENKIAYIEEDSTWRKCKSYTLDTTVNWYWKRLVNIDGKLYPFGYAPAGTYDCNNYKCVSTEYLNPNVTYGEFLDTRDNKVYKTLYMGDQLWMAQNLVYTKGNDSLSGANIVSKDSLKKGSYYLAGSPCPTGWTNPTRDDFRALVRFIGDTTLNVLKSANDMWSNASELTNPYGFSLVKSRNIVYLTEGDGYAPYRGTGMPQHQQSGQGASLWLDYQNSMQMWYVEVCDLDQKFFFNPEATFDRYKTVRCIAVKDY